MTNNAPFGTVSCEECEAETPVTFDGKTNGPDSCPKCGAPLWEADELPYKLEKFVDQL